MPTPPPTEPGVESARRKPRDSALARAIGLLSRREHSSIELKRKLIQRGFDQDEVEAALSRLQQAGLQDDTRFAESLVRSRAGSGRGPMHLRAELAQHGVKGEQSSALLEDASEQSSWTERALELARRRFPNGVSDARERRRLADLLVRRGFGGDSIRAVLSALSPGAEHDEEHAGQ
jgi:regulatory protein